MSKLWYPSEKQLTRIRPINENIWLRQYQTILLEMVKSQEGRDLLCVDKEFQYLKIVRIAKNYMRFETSPGHSQTDFRVGAKWGNIIRYRWDDIQPLMARIEVKHYLEWLLTLPPLVVDGRQVHRVAGGTTLTAFPDPDPETSSWDGVPARVVGGGETWANIRAGASNSGGDNDAGGYGPRIQGHTNTDQYEEYYIAITLFDTSSISSDSIDDATFSHVATERATAIGDLVSNISEATAASDTASSGTDYANTIADHSTKLTDAGVALSALNVDDATRNDFVLNASGEAAINKSGATKLSVRHEGDIDNVEVTWSSGSRSYLRFNMADTTGTDKDPRLIVNHTAAGPGIDEMMAARQVGEGQPILTRTPVIPY